MKLLSIDSNSKLAKTNAKVINDTDGRKMDRCANVLGQWSHYGAADTGGYDMLRTIFSTVFGDKYND
jgi:hypothetical protein